MPKIDLDAMIDDLEKGLNPIEPYILSWPREKSISKKPWEKLISENKVHSALIQMDSGMIPDIYIKLMMDPENWIFLTNPSIN